MGSFNSLTHPSGGLADRRGLDQRWELLLRRERRMLRPGLEESTRALEQKLPDSLRQPLETAFAKGFAYVFANGMGPLQKLGRPQNLQTAQDIRAALYREWSADGLRQLDQRGRTAAWTGFALSAAEGAALGLVGLGLPDIPLLLAGLLGIVCSIARGYGIPCDTPQEECFLLAVLAAAAAPSALRAAAFARCDRIATQLIRSLPLEVERQTLVEDVSHLLAGRLLVAKAVQGMPVVGVAGGLLSSQVVKQVGDVANLKYQKRILLDYHQKRGIPL